MESVQAEDESAQLCKRRIEHLKEHSSDQPAAAGLWKRKRMDRMMAEHLLRCGYYNTAVKLARQSGIEDLVNIEMFLTAKEVEESLERRETATCLAWCHDNKSRLRKMKVWLPAGPGGAGPLSQNEAPFPSWFRALGIWS